MKGRGKRHRFLWFGALMGFMAALVAWQGVQALTLGAVGVPGVLLVEIADDPDSVAEEDAPFAGGVTTVAKTSPGRAGEVKANGAALPQLRPSVAPSSPAEPEYAARPAGEDAPELPSEGEIRGWIKSQAREFVGGVDEQGMPLYRFDVWLEAPTHVRQRIAMVAYDFDAPFAKPKEQESREQGNGFRVKFGGASCARTVVVTVTLEDGRSQAAEVDGCAILD